MNGQIYHIPVLLNEALEQLHIKPGKKYIDCTYGGGGHTRAIEAVGGIVLGIDRDPESPARVHANFAHLKEIANRAGFNPVAGILMDLGVSSHQLETAERGFSFNRDAKLDMRMDPATQTVTAADLVNAGSQKELAVLFTKFGEERASRPIAKAIVEARSTGPIVMTDQLAQIILRVRRRGQADRTHPATRVFQALRIAVNDELSALEAALPQAVELLETGGRLVVISFHSLEDRIIKNFMKNKTLITPTKEEVKANPRARSAKMRFFEK
ncbi:MAG: 16S rRNA (cytosine(1402)-N(4))-methyltransferase RsmH [Patescibacteria group bacterium]|nr:16S rRNA (cytosine(1402)-N(4))-methyltransferase RsmH [Patescibacteria group bacterium]MCL5431723.1 16S rRNA (cytosine(1402)-N(4))-methyltransferase RsmH [Patescibacteria group bacterium]